LQTYVASVKNSGCHYTLLEPRPFQKSHPKSALKVLTFRAYYCDPTPFSSHQILEKAAREIAWNERLDDALRFPSFPVCSWPRITPYRACTRSLAISTVEPGCSHELLSAGQLSDQS